MSAKLIGEYGVFPTVLQDSTILISVGSMQIPIDISMFKIALEQDCYYFSNSDVFFYGKSAKGSELVLRWDGTGTIYTNGAVRTNSSFDIPDAIKNMKVIHKGCVGDNSKNSVKYGLTTVLFEDSDVGVLLSQKKKTPFVFSISKNPKYMATLFNPSFGIPELDMKDSVVITKSSENNVKSIPVFGEYVNYGMEVTIL